MAPLISIVIPVGPGHEQYVPQALASIAYQTLPAEWLEPIVIDDTAGQHGGAGAARNAGIAQASAPLITFLDADDYLTPTGLEALLRGYAHHDEAYAYGDWWDAWTPERVKYRVATYYDQRSHLIGGQHTVTALMATEDVRSIGGFENLSGWEDWDFWCKMAVNGLCGTRVPHPIIVYRIDKGFRREASSQQREPLKAAHLAKYGRYISGEAPIMGCGCGNSNAKATARNAVARLGGASAMETNSGARVRMQFIGQARGGVTFRSQKTGERYRGGNNDNDRFINAHPDDVEWLKSFGSWREVPRLPSNPGVPPPPPAVAPLQPEVVAEDTVAESVAFEEPTEGKASPYPGKKKRKA